ncbi:MAG: DUF503 domain-containing protein [Candidatus Neomarinimicrobiota bacterium]
MAVGILQIELRLLSPHSLKEKRSILRPVKKFLQKDHKVSVAEVGNHDVWQSSSLEIAMASNDPSSLHGRLTRISDILESRFPVVVTGEKLEIV